MKLYIDDNLIDQLLVHLLRKVNHQVVVPADANLAGAPDPRHLLYARNQGLTLLTANHGDFRDLHDLVVGCGGTHAGILLVYFDNDSSRDMKPADMARAIRKLDAAKVALANQLIVLNQWR